MIHRCAAALIVLVVLFAACDSGGSDDINDPGVLDDGESLGSIERIPGGTAVPSDTRLLVSVACSAGELVIITSQERILGAMDCDRMFPAEILANFIGQEVAIRADGDRLIVENETAGTLEFPVEEPHVEPVDATP